MQSELLDDPDMLEDEQAMPEAQPMPIEMIAAQGVDLAFLLDDQKLAEISTKCLEAYHRDLEERRSWEESFDKVMKLVSGEREEKSFPWPGAANVKYPLIMTAALQFGSRAYPAIVNGTDVVKPAAVGDDPKGEKRKRGDRVATHMNYQLLHDMPEWDSDTDRLCHTVSIQGCMFRQVIWDSEYARPLTTLISGKDLVVTQNAKDLETVPHFAKQFPLFQHQLKEKMKLKQYRETDLGMQDDEEKAGEQEMLECHFRWDLDEDGYEEPYICVIHKKSEKLLSLKAGFWPRGIERDIDGSVARIRRHVEFIKHEFLPDPEGKFYGIGFGSLLLEHNEIVNSLINQLMDAATDQNAGGGFLARGANLQGGALDFEIGEWKFIDAEGSDLRQSIVPRPTAQPSPVLFQLLGMMIDASKELASVRDVMSGDAPTNQPATTTLAIIEQGMQVFSSIYKRLYRSLTKEFQLIGRLNSAYLSPEQYNNIIDIVDEETGERIIFQPRVDYGQQDRDIIPVADPSMTTSAQRLQRAQFLMQMGAGNPMLDQREILRRVLEAASIDDIESLMPKPDPQQQAMQMEEMKTQMRGVLAEIMETETSAMENAANARLKQIEGDVKAQEAAIELAAMKFSAMQMMGAAYEQAPMGGMGGMAFAPPNAAVYIGPTGSVGAPTIPMAKGSMGQPGMPPAPGNAGPAIPVEGLPGPVPN